jgi:arylsulfatase
MKYNIIIIVMDAVRARNMSCYRYSRNTTPNIDEFSKKAVLYENAISPAPWTLPAVVSLFTGLLPSEHGVIDEKNKLTKPSLASILKKEGYETIAFSNNPWVSRNFGLDQGFDKFYEFDKYTFPSKGIPRIIELIKAGLSLKDYGAEITNINIIKYLEERDRNKPFFMYVHYIEPHHPYNPRRPFNKKFGNKFPWDLIINKRIRDKKFPDFYSGDWKISDSERRILIDLYDGEIAYLDYKIGELLDNISYLLDETLIIITADHGQCFGEERELRIIEHQIGLYDDLIKVPLIVKYPERGKERVYNQVQLTDIFGTIIDIVGKKSNFPSLLEKEECEELSKYAFSEYTPPIHTLNKITDDRINKIYREKRIAIRTNDYKLINNINCKKELYNLKNDPLEYNNIYYSDNKLIQEIRKELMTKLEQKFIKTHIENERIKIKKAISKHKDIFKKFNT